MGSDYDDSYACEADPEADVYDAPVVLGLFRLLAADEACDPVSVASRIIELCSSAVFS